MGPQTYRALGQARKYDYHQWNHDLATSAKNISVCVLGAVCLKHSYRLSRSCRNMIIQIASGRHPMSDDFEGCMQFSSTYLAADILLC